MVSIHHDCGRWLFWLWHSFTISGIVCLVMHTLVDTPSFGLHIAFYMNNGMIPHGGILRATEGNRCFLRIGEALID